MSFAAEETFHLTSRQRRKRSKGHRHEMKHLSGGAATVDDVSNQGVSDQLYGGLDEEKLVDQLENEDTQSSLSMQHILGGFLATKLQVIESENERIPRRTIYNKCQKDKSHKSSRKTSNKRSSDFSDVLANDEFKYDKNANDCWSDSKNPKCLDFWNDSERLSSCAMLDRTCMKTVLGDHRRSRQSRGKVHKKRSEKISRETVHHSFRSSALKNRNGLERSFVNEAFPFSEVSLERVPSSDKEEDGYGVGEGESGLDFPLEISHEHLSNVKEDNRVKSENHVHKSKRKRSFTKKSKEMNESRHRKSKKSRTRKDSVEVSTFTNPNFQTDSGNAKTTQRCYQDSLYDDVNSVASENDEKDFGFSSERHFGSRQKSCDYFEQSTRRHKPDNYMFNSRKRNADLELNDRDHIGDETWVEQSTRLHEPDNHVFNSCKRNADFELNARDHVGDETWVERYNRTKIFKRRRSDSGSVPAEADTDSLQYDEYSHLSTIDPVWGHSSKHNRLVCEGKLHTSRGDKSDNLSHNRNKTHSRTKSPMSSSKKKSSRKVKHVNKREKKHKHRDKSLVKSSHKHKSTKHKHRKNKTEEKVLAESNEAVEIVKSCVLPSDDDADDDNFRPMLIPVETNDDITELWLGKRTTLKDDASEQCGKLQLDYNAVVACAEKISVPSRIVKTYKDGIAVSRLLRRVKTRIGPLRSAEISRLQATLPRHPVLTVDKFSQKESANNDQVQNSTVFQDVEDPGVQKQEQPQTCSTLPTISDVTAERTSDDILQPGVLGENTVVEAGPVNYLGLTADRSDPNHQDQLPGQTGASLETVSVDVLPEYSQVPTQDIEAETSVDPLMTVEMVAATVQPCLRMSSESVVTGIGSVEITESETYPKDPLQEETTPEVAPEAVVNADVQTISVEPCDNLTSHKVIELLENSCIQHSSEQDKHMVADEVQGDLSSNCDILPELACGCSDGGSQIVGNEEVTAIISPNEERSLEAVAVAIVDPSVSHGTTFADETGHLSDTCQQDEVSENRENQTQCFTLDVSDIVGIGTEMTGIEESQREVPEKEMTVKEVNEGDASVNEVREIEVIGKEMTGMEVCENEARENEVGDVEAECHCTEKETNPENEEVVNKASNSQDMLCIESEVGHTKENVFCSGQSSSAELEGGTQTLKTNYLNRFVRAGCSDNLCDTEPCFESAKSQSSKDDCKTVQKAAKKLARDMGIKISGWSAAFISSGTRYENDPKKRNREEGEITDSSANSSESEDFEPAPLGCLLDLVSSGSLSESVQEETEEPVVKHKSKQRKKHKRKHKKHKKQKRRHSIESSSDEEQSRSRSRSRSFSVARIFDGAKGVWREKKHKTKRKKIPVKNRPRLNIDKEKLREIAIKNSLHNQMSFKKPMMMKLSESTGNRPGGKTVAELTDFCKTISGKMDYNTSSSEDENNLDVRQRVTDSLEDDSETFMCNFMKGRDKDARIVLNIRDSRQLPALSAQEMIAKKAVMRLMFPVSSGAQHRQKEEGWVPVTKPDAEKPFLKPQVPITDLSFPTVTIPAVPPTSAGAAAFELATARAPVVENPLPLLPLNVDVHTIITERLAAIRRLNANPTDEQAMGDVLRAQMQMQQWAEEKQIPGQFFSSVLRMGLMGNKLKKHDWLRRTKQNPEPGLVPPDAAAAVLPSDPPGGDGATNSNSTLNLLAAIGPDRTYNIGKLMLLRMGWKENEGLGRQNLGRLLPLSLDMKKDRKGLQAPEERTRPMAQVLSVKGKHPVSALLETCVKRRIGQPEFVLAEETGPSHLRRFLYKVLLNGVEYRPNIGSHNKKTAKLQAAACCLDALGLSEESK